ncbi:MAG: pyridine nucleotide-disulfide oxidoreductase [Comamonadaceae bacterium]|nr:pyridine nucleotide-disulfide oxidoreductase [Comamonadaceae bacterium]
MKKLLLLGVGHAHVQVLAQLARHRPADLDVTVLTPYPFQTYSGMVPGLVAGRYSASECQIPLEPLVKAAGARWVQGRCTGLDLAQQTVQLDAAGGNKAAPASLPYHLLSIDTGAIIDRQRLEADMPGAAAHALIVRPIESFAALWPQVLELAQKQAVSLAVIGSGAAGIELVFAAEQCLRRQGLPGASFTLITGGGDPAANYPEGVRRRVLRQLKRRGITVLREVCTGVDKGLVQLGSGASLACDVPILAIGTHAPVWLQGSGLALSESGHVLVNACQQSSSHPNVFAAGDVASRADTPHPKSGVYAVRAGPPLTHNLMAAHQGQPLKAWHPPQRTLNLLSCGAGHAIASWGPLHTEGAWVWRWKDRIDRAFMARYTLPAA